MQFFRTLILHIMKDDSYQLNWNQLFHFTLTPVQDLLIPGIKREVSLFLPYFLQHSFAAIVYLQPLNKPLCCMNSLICSRVFSYRLHLLLSTHWKNGTFT